LSVRRLWRLAPLAAGMACAWAQTGATGATSTGIANGTIAGSANTNPSNATGGSTGLAAAPPSGSSPGTGGPRPIFLSGIVMMDDGSPLPGIVNIQSLCGGVRRTMSQTSSSGGFAFQWSGTSAVFGDASQLVRLSGGGGGAASLAGSRSGSRGMDPLANCDLTAEYPGHSSSKASLYNRAGDTSYDVGVIILHRIRAGEGSTVSALSLKAPKEAKKNFDKGTSFVAANKLMDALASFKKAVEAYPDYADAWLSMGKVQWQMGDKDAAGTSFRKASDLDGKLVGPWQALGFLACDDSKWEDAARYLDQAVRLDPIGSPNAWYFHALASYNLGRFEVAERSVRAEIRLDRGKNPREDFLLGLILIARQDPEGGAQALRNFLASGPSPEDARLAQRQLTRLEGQARQ
jgi:tetratricopeptide (TPR) repeat protein